MARRKMDPEKRSFIKGLLEHYQPKDAQDVQNMLKDLLGETLQDMLESEMDEHLGYSKYDYRNKETEDSRNGYSAKTVTSWRNNWPQLSVYFKYPPEIRRLIYTTNAIENFNRQLRKVTKAKSVFPTDDALFKILYLAMSEATEKWTGKAWDWGQTLDQLYIYFEGRISPEDIM